MLKNSFNLVSVAVWFVASSLKIRWFTGSRKPNQLSNRMRANNAIRSLLVNNICVHWANYHRTQTGDEINSQQIAGNQRYFVIILIARFTCVVVT